MSHVRNLFQRPVGQGNDRSSAPVALAPEENIPAVAKAFDLGETLIEEVHIQVESRIVFYTAPHSPAADRFRYLRMRLRERWNTGKLKSLLITSPLPHDGKSTVTLNLATALSEGGNRKVLVIEADLHRSPLIQYLGLKGWSGLTDCIDAGLNPLSAIRQLEPLGWYLLPAGEPRRNPTELLQSPVLSGVTQTLSPYFDWILIDAPPVIPLTDALSLRQRADASLLVVRAGRTPKQAIDEAVALLGKQHILGMVLNGVEGLNQRYVKYGYNRGKNVESPARSE
jgi:succinoglycan biosynthesis transport protein ExoP